MTLKYVGSRAFKRRLAEFGYSEKEEERFLKIVDYLRGGHGYEVDTGVCGWAAIEVNDRDEFNEVREAFKEAKRQTM